MWRYCREFIRKTTDMATLGSFMIGIGDIIGCAFYQMPAGEWSAKLDTIINAHPQILLYKEWDDVYNSLKTFNYDEIEAMPFNLGFYAASNDKNKAKIAQDDFYRHFCDVYNSLPSFNDSLDFFQKGGLRLREDIPFNIV